MTQRILPRSMFKKSKRSGTTPSSRQRGPTISSLRKAFWPLVALLSPIVALSIYFAGNWYSLLHDYSLGMVLGIFSYGYFLNALIISSRIRFFDRRYGHVDVLVFHGYLAVVAMLFAVGHRLLKSAYYREMSTQIGFGVVGFYLFLAVVALSVLFMDNRLLRRLKPFVALRRFGVGVLRLDYSLLKLFHNATSVAALLVTVHVLMASSTREDPLRIALMGGWAGVAGLMYLHHKAVRPFLAWRKGWRVTAVIPLTEAIVELRMRRPGKPVGRRPGQFGYFRILSRDCGSEEHPFTISSAPENDELRITVKNLGDYSATLKHVCVGTKVMMDGPYGIFTPPVQPRPLLFIAGGIGITPFMSMVASWRHHTLERPCTLIWSVRTAEELVRRELFDTTAKERAMFSFVPVVTRSVQPGFPYRRIDKRLLESHSPPALRKQMLVYLCGPESMQAAAAKYLKELGVPSGNIHREAFLR
ncbi:MAG: hypothetical protein GF344_07585 [Chitinivibrionales bacterium]|nr:hypothetical protein [Chitinivibrionales bacterium]MBD3356760.1 hypothetical protein [Chitinivibrionales bacterium]